VHLRFGPVARGGLRWSDRAQDYRTEVLGLVKAQQVKNAVIVPVGAKGGFYPKRCPPAAAATRSSTPAGGLQDLHPHAAVGHRQSSSATASCRRPMSRARDGDDPYFVVAADKGTATFSDTANGIAQEARLLAGRRLRLGRLGRLRPQEDGHHRPRRLGSGQAPFPRDGTATSRPTPFTVVGVGDMSGDVFGNGMLLSPQIRLIAAFDHRDIFIDPDPGHREILRRAQAHVRPAALELAGLRQGLLSKGGMIIRAREKSVTLTPEAQAPSAGQGPGDALRDHDRDPQGAGRPAVVRRHRHLSARQQRDRCRGRRPRQ
jgi:glutamate dehydrogenase